MTSHSRNDTGRGLYSDAAGQPALRDSFAGFVDELGFSARIEQLTSEELRDDITRYDAVRLNFGTPSGELDQQLRVLYFSDNVGLAMPVVPQKQDGGLHRLLTVVAAYQMEMSLGGRFTRGGIARGQLYADHSFITGEALVRAVNLEKTAKFPRVVVGEGCLGPEMRKTPVDAKEASSDMTNTIGNLGNLIIRDNDKVIVNYLSVLFNGSYEEWRTRIVLENHRDHIRQRIEKFKDDESIFSKYQWLASYHDFVVTTTIQLPEYVIGAAGLERFALI